MTWSRLGRQQHGSGVDRLRSNEDGSVLETAIVVPAAMMVLFVAVQAALWAHAETVAQASAERAVRAASVAGGSLAAGRAEAQALLARTGQVVTQPSVLVEATAGDTVHVHVAGMVEAIVPWVHLTVSADRTGTRQEFRQSG